MTHDKSYLWKKELLYIFSYVAGALILLIVTGWATSDTYYLLLLAWLTIFLILLIDLIVGLLILLVGKHLSLNALRIAIACLIFLPASLIYSPCSEFFWECRYATAQAYPPKIEVQLEAYYQIHGQYPETLKEVPGLPALPAKLFYSRSKVEYNFDYPGLNDADGTYDHYWYSSKTRLWEHNGGWP